MRRDGGGARTGDVSRRGLPGPVLQERFSTRQTSRPAATAATGASVGPSCRTSTSSPPPGRPGAVPTRQGWRDSSLSSVINQQARSAVLPTRGSPRLSAPRNCWRLWTVSTRSRWSVRGTAVLQDRSPGQADRDNALTPHSAPAPARYPQEDLDDNDNDSL